MLKKQQLTRRSFLVGSSAIAGGVVFSGCGADDDNEGNSIADSNDNSERIAPTSLLTPWVSVDQSGITLITPHTDMGQGAAHMQASLIAEELDVELSQITVSPGNPSNELYGNTGIAVEGLPPFQSTGGSSSVRDSFEKLRRTGAVARETLKLAASQAMEVAVDQLQTEQGFVISPNGQRLSYTELASLAAQLEPVNEVSLRPSSQWRIVGRPSQRLDIASKSTGELAFGIDLEVEGMVHATVKLNPRQGGELISFDASQALTMRGVQNVIRVTSGLAVIADNTWRAFEAANAIQCEWGEASYPPEMAQHWEAVSESFVEERLNLMWRNDGEIEQTPTSLEVEYRAPYVAHAPLEPLSAIVRISSNRADIWTSTQMPTIVQATVGAMAGLEASQVFVHNQYAGGSFGHRLESDFIYRCAEIALALPDTPVKLTYSREEDFLHDYPRQLTAAKMSGSADSGLVHAADIQVASVSPLLSSASRLGLPFPPGAPDEEVVAGIAHAPYAIPHFRVRGYQVPGLAPVSSWRSVGASSNGFFMEGFLDELIHQAGADPLQERIRLAASNNIARGVLEAVGEMSNWGSDLGENRARGIAFIESFGTPVAEVVEISQTEDGIKIDRVYVAVDVGPVVDPVNLEAQITGGVVWGLGHAMNCEITYADGMPEQSNYHAHEGMRLHQCPEITVRSLANRENVSGMGEPSVPPAAPALANAIFALTGQRLREMPFHKFIRFV